MAQTRVSIYVPPRGTKWNVAMPDDVVVGRLIPALVNRLGLPPDRVSYHLDNPETGERLANDVSLAQAGIQSDAMLYLVPEVVAGRYNGQHT